MKLTFIFYYSKLQEHISHMAEKAHREQEGEAWISN